MAKEICISSTPHETRLAILEDDQLAEIYYERENEYTLAGSIYNGRVTRVLPGMQSAFVDVGLERDAFLYVTDFLELEDAEETDELEKAAASGGNQPPREVRHGAATVAARRGRARRTARAKDLSRSRRRRPDSPREETAKGRILIESEPEAETPLPPLNRPVVSEAAGDGQEDSGAPGAKRWRGRRRRRGGRGAQGSPEGQPEPEAAPPSLRSKRSPRPKPQVAPEIHAAGDSADRSSSPRRTHAEPAPRFERPLAARLNPVCPARRVALEVRRRSGGRRPQRMLPRPRRLPGRRAPSSPRR